MATGKSAAAQAAKALLAERIALVDQLGAAVDAHQRARDAITAAQATADAAAAEVQAAFDAAKAGGWTTAELHKVGLRAPAAPRKRKKTAAPHQNDADKTTPSNGLNSTSAA